MKKQISIIGCGWLGLPLAKALIANGYTVKGATTTKEKIAILKESHIQPYRILLKEHKIEGNLLEFLSESETLIINIPPGLRKDANKNHVQEITHLFTAAKNSNIKNVLYISSTSVFKDEPNFPVITNITQPNADSNNAKQLIEIEQMFQSSSKFRSTILRFGGLFGAERHPAKYMAGKLNLSNPEAPINLIHKQDSIGIILNVLNKDLWNRTLNAVFPLHPTKKDYYTAYCKKLDLEAPLFNTTQKSKGKIIDTSTLVQLLEYSYKQAP